MPRASLVLLLGSALLLAPALTAAAPPPSYPEGSNTPRGLTGAERAWLAENPLHATVTPPPTGPLHCPAEYEPVAAVLIAWEGSAAFKNILTAMGREITTTGDADLYVVVDDTTEQGTAAATLAAGGVDMARVSFLVTPTDTIWIRDYGPRFVYEGGCRSLIDHTYNRPRPNDNVFPAFYAATRRAARYEIPLIHGGGNFHLDALSRSHATRLIVNENRSLTEPQIHDLWRDYQGLDTTFYDPFPTGVDSTQHIDMWMQVIADDAVLISDWPDNPGSRQDQICDDATATLTARGITVYRPPAYSVNGTHYTWTNSVMVNDLVLIPSYTQPQVAPHNAVALAVWQTALPTKRIVPIPAQDIVTSAGVLHCIVMQVPAPLGGAIPTTWVRAPRGCQTVTPGSPLLIEWLTDDDKGVTSVDILLSRDGGVTFPTTVVTGAPDTGSYPWTVPAPPTASARLRVVVHDADGNSAFNDSDIFAIGTTGSGPSQPKPLLAVRRGGDVELVYPDTPGAWSWNLYEGAIRAYYSAESPRCHRDRLAPGVLDNRDGTFTMHATPAGGSRWFLLSASNCFAESDLGRGAQPWLCGPD